MGKGEFSTEIRDEIIDLIRLLVHFNPDRRLTADEALHKAEGIRDLMLDDQRTRSLDNLCHYKMRNTNITSQPDAGRGRKRQYDYYGTSNRRHPKPSPERGMEQVLMRLANVTSRRLLDEIKLFMN